jgi:hypothetical protein
VRFKCAQCGGRDTNAVSAGRIFEVGDDLRPDEESALRKELKESVARQKALLAKERASF